MSLYSYLAKQPLILTPVYCSEVSVMLNYSRVPVWQLVAVEIR